MSLAGAGTASLATAIGLSLAVFAAWLVLAWRLLVERRRAPRLPAPLAEIPPTTVLLPVRDEEENVAECVASLLAGVPPALLRVIDDGSTDRTPEILAELARRESRLTRLTAPPLPAGWRGKLHALATGLEGVESPWILFTDADTRHRPDLLARAHAAAARDHLDAVSLSGHQSTPTLGEALLTPAVFALLDRMLGDFRPYARGEGAVPIANGQFVLLRREALNACGGLAAIAGEALDDVALARLLHAAGFRVGFLLSGEALHVRMYRGFKATFRGWRRNLTLFVAARPVVVGATLLFAASQVAAFAVALSTGAPGLALGTWAAGALANAAIRRSAGHRAWPALLAPLDLLLLAGTLTLALLDRARGRTSAWRGRTIDLGS